MPPNVDRMLVYLMGINGGNLMPARAKRGGNTASAAAALRCHGCRSTRDKAGCNLDASRPPSVNLVNLVDG